MGKPTFFRAFPADLEQTSPTTLSGRLVPYDVPADVMDIDTVTGERDIYKEGFRLGAFSNQAKSKERAVVGRIGLVHTHESTGLGYLGPFTKLREEADGLHGDVRVLPSKADDLTALIDSGIGELSIEFRLPGDSHTRIDDDGIRWRTRAHLDQVALEPRGAYRTAEVLAFRAELDELAKADADRRLSQSIEDEQRALIEAEAEAAARRRAEFEALCARLPDAQQKQDEYLRRYVIGE